MNEAAEQALDNFRHEQALSIAHAKRADGYLTQFLRMVDTREGHPGTPSGSSVRCVREWTRWLSENGPALRSTIAEETGVKFTERGTPHTFVWDDSMADFDDDAFPANAIMRIRGASSPGRGAPPVIFFLWSQRWDVHPLFGVGPQEIDDARIMAVSVDTEPGLAHGAITGVIQPPVSSHPIDPAYGEEVPMFRPEWPVDDTIEDGYDGADGALPVRCATIEEWDNLHSPLFDVLVSADAKPSEEQKQTLRDTLPDGAEPNAAIAIAYRSAVERSRQQALVEYPGQEVIGSHNHLPHTWGPLCRISDCRPT